MTLSPELLAMIKDVKPASDEEIKILLHTMSDPFVADFCVGEIIVSSLIARIVAERKVAILDCIAVADKFARNNEGSSNPEAWAAFTVSTEIARALSALEERG